MNTDNNSNYNQKIKDFAILEDIVNNRVSIDDIDNDTKIRIIELCNERISQIEHKTVRIEKKCEELSKIIKNQTTDTH